MWPFTKRQKDLTSLPAISAESHTWAIAEATRDGSPLLIRFNSGAQSWLGHPALGTKIGFAVPLNFPNEGGMPEPSENQQLNDVEDVILRELESRAKGIPAFVLTTGTMKEFVYYVTADTDFAALHQAVQSGVSTHEVQCMAETDPNWSVYRAFIPT